MFRPNQQQFRVNEQELNALLQEAFNQGAQRGKTAAAFGLGQNGQAAPKTSSIASHIFQTLYNDPFKLLQAGLVLGTASHLNKMQQATGNLSAALVNTAKATELLSQSAANLATSVQTATTIVNDAVSIISNHHFEYVLAGAAFIAAATHFESRYHPLKIYTTPHSKQQMRC
jgi:hypothetical protein